MRTIHKFPVELSANHGRYASFEVQTHAGARVLMVAGQRNADDLPTIWMEVEEDMPQEVFTFALVPTGGEVPEGYEHLGSAVCAGVGLVWHVYRETVKRR